MEYLQTLLTTLNNSPRPTIVIALVVAGIVLVWAGLVRAIDARDALNEAKLNETGTSTGTGPTRAVQLFLYFTVGLSLLMIFFVFASFSEGKSEGRAFVTMAALILMGIAAFIGILNLLSRSAHRIGMIDARHPFGLPEGSVRAILTIAFIVLVGVLSAFLITSHNNRSPFAVEGVVVASGLTETEANELAKTLRGQFGSEALIGIVPAKPPPPAPVPRTAADAAAKAAADAAAKAAAGTPSPTGTETAPAAPQLFDVHLHAKVDNSMGDDIAKQTLTMISTILAAMIGFYFAERSSSAREAAATDGNDAAPDVVSGLKSQLTAAVTTAKTTVEGLRGDLASLATATPPAGATPEEETRIKTGAEAARKAQTGTFAALEKLLASTITALENAAATPAVLRKALGDAATINATKRDDLLKQGG